MKLIEIITAAIAAVFAFKTTIKELKEAVKQKDDKLAEQAAVIAELQSQHEQDALDDAALETAANDAKAAAEAALIRTQELEQLIAAADEKSAELAQAINDNPETPVVADDFTVTAPAPTA